MPDNYEGTPWSLKALEASLATRRLHWLNFGIYEQSTPQARLLRRGILPILTARAAHHAGNLANTPADRPLALAWHTLILPVQSSSSESGAANEKQLPEGCCTIPDAHACVGSACTSEPEGPAFIAKVRKADGELRDAEPIKPNVGLLPKVTSGQILERSAVLAAAS